MTTNYHITKNALEVRVPETTDIDDCGTMDFHFDLHTSLNWVGVGQAGISMRSAYDLFKLWARVTSIDQGNIKNGC